MAENTEIQELIASAQRAKAIREGGQPAEAAAPAEAAPTVQADAATPVIEGEPKTEEPKLEPPAAVEPKPAELDEKARLKIINDALGTNYKTLDEAKPKVNRTKEEIEAEAAKESNEALEWAIGTQKIKRDLYEKAIVEKSKGTRDLALALFTAQAKEADPKLTDEEIGEEFKDYFMEEVTDESTPREKRLRAFRIKEMEGTVQNYLNSNYGDVDKILDNYREYRGTTAKQESFGEQLKNNINALPAELSFTVTEGDGDKAVNHTYTFPIDEDLKKAVKKELSNVQAFNTLTGGTGEINEKALNSAIDYALKARSMDKIISAVAKQHADKQTKDLQARLKAIPATGVSTHVTLTPDSSLRPPEHTSLKKAQAKQGYN